MRGPYFMALWSHCVPPESSENEPLLGTNADAHGAESTAVASMTFPSTGPSVPRGPTSPAAVRVHVLLPNVNLTALLGDVSELGG